MPLQVTPELEELIQCLLRQGRYSDESEVLKQALQLLQRRDELRAQIQVGIDQLDRGERLTAEKVFADVRARIDEIEREQQ